MESNRKTIIGIVIAQNHRSGNYYVWSKDWPYDGQISAGSKRIKLGDWVVVTVYPQDKIAICFDSSRFRVIHPIFDTETVGGVLEINFDQFLQFNQYYVDHSFFGNMRISDNISSKEGKWTLTIKSRKTANLREPKTEWIVEEISAATSQQSEPFVLGIVVGINQFNYKMWAWCGETAVGEDLLLIRKIADIERIRVGTWLKIQRFNGQYTIIEPIHRTVCTGKSISLILECFLERNTMPVDIFHPFVGLIINSDHLIIGKSGKYNIEIARRIPKVGRDGSTKSVWFLKNCSEIINEEIIDEMVVPTSSAISYDGPLPKPEELSLRFNTVLSNAFQPQLQNPRPANIMIPAIPRQSLSPAPAFNQTQRAKAIVTKIHEKRGFDNIFIWTLQDHSDGFINLQCAAEKYGLEEGHVFEADDFVRNGEQIRCKGLNLSIHPDKPYETRFGNACFDFKVFASDYKKAGNNCIYPTIWHDDFGHIVDNHYKLSEGANLGLKFHFWIRRCRVERLGGRRWVVIEKINR